MRHNPISHEYERTGIPPLNMVSGMDHDHDLTVNLLHEKVIVAKPRCLRVPLVKRFGRLKGVMTPRVP